MTGRQDVQAGSQLPDFEPAPVSRLSLALYCGASGDHNPVHVDLDFARSAGLDDVIAHGMLSMSWLGQMLTRWVQQEDIREYQVRFASVTRVGERLRCSGRVVDIVEEGGERLARLALIATNQDGEVKLDGAARVVLEGGARS